MTDYGLSDFIYAQMFSIHRGVKSHRTEFSAQRQITQLLTHKHVLKHICQNYSLPTNPLIIASTT